MPKLAPAVVTPRAVGNLVGGFTLAATVAFTLAVPTIGSLSTWKIVLGLVGFVIFVRAGRLAPFTSWDRGS